MRKKKIIHVIMVMAMVLAFALVSVEAKVNQQPSNRLAKPLLNPTDAKYLTTNNIKMPIQNDAAFSQNPFTGRAGTEWPQGTGNMYLFGSGIWIGAQIPSGSGLKKVVSYGYNPNDGYSEWGPGIITAPYTADHGGTDAATMWPIVLSTEVDSWTPRADSLWPVRDSLGNPEFVSAEDSWCFYNDADITYHDAQASSGDQLNVFVKQTTYSFNSKLDKNIIFVVWDIYNQGDRDLDSVYIGITSDPDLGNATDDMIGFDAPRNFCWVYNYNLEFDQDIQGRPGMMGFRYFQSPLDSAGGTQLGLTALTLFTIDTDPANDEERYNLMAGLTKSGNPRPGGPFDVDVSPQDKRFCQSSGPFKLKIGDSTRVVFGVVAGENENLLKINSDYAQTLYNAHFVAPRPPVAPVVKAVPGDRKVTLVWGDTSESSIEPFAASDTSLRQFDFEGYRVYRSRTGVEGDFQLLAEFDLKDGITNVITDAVDPTTGLPITVVVHLGEDTGIQRFFVDSANVINGETYSYAVTAFDYQPKNPRSLESGVRASMVQVVAGTNPAGYIAPTAMDTATHTSSGRLSEGVTTVEIIDPTQVTGDDYRVTFNTDLTWNLIDLTKGDTLLANQTNQSGDNTYKILDGIMVRVSGPPTGIRDWGWSPTAASRWMTGVDWGGTYFFGGLDLGYYFFGSSITDLSTDFVNVDIRFSPTTKQKAYDYLRGGTPSYGCIGYFEVPFTVWDTTSSPARQLNAAFVDNRASTTYDSTWGPSETSGDREYLFIFNSTYTDTALTWYLTHRINANASGGQADSFDVLYAMWPLIRSGHSLSELADGQIFHIIATKPNAPADVFSFSTKAAYINANQAKFDMDKIKVVPNPYFVRNELDRDPNVSHLMFTHLPDKCTIRIYTLAGNLIQQLEHNSDSGQETWNVLTRNDQIPASGVYIYHISSDFGDKVGRFAIIR
jgi:TusA-related sulfurtransferase